MRDIAHLCARHLAQLRAILDDKEASPNDHFVALDCSDANIAAGGILPAARTRHRDRDGSAAARADRRHDEAAIARGVFDTYVETNLRYSQVARSTCSREQHRQ